MEWGAEYLSCSVMELNAITVCCACFITELWNWQLCYVSLNKILWSFVNIFSWIRWTESNIFIPLLVTYCHWSFPTTFLECLDPVLLEHTLSKHASCQSSLSVQSLHLARTLHVQVVDSGVQSLQTSQLVSDIPFM
jgi:hypothetical protein